ncbi:hypothetical protein [Sphingosinicella soli]|uniref:hypothetical protein n=1 Tax=Sphingosinicella soli TaxID=333708 RepID=UPI001FB14B20|nr:hypothetical protein [Sphingosinicella soli]
MIQLCGDFGAHASVLVAGQGDGRHDFPDKLMQVAPIAQVLQGQFQLGLGGMQIIPRRGEALCERCHGGRMDHDVGCRRLLVQIGFQPVALDAQFLAGSV